MALPPRTHLELCAGAGGLALGLKRAVARLRTVAYVERDAFAAACLVAGMGAQTLDSAPIWDDLVTFDGRPWHGRVDLVSGGTPCQDLSAAGKRAGLDGERSGLFREFLRVVREVRPEFVFWENVASGVTGAALPRVVGSLHDAGYCLAEGPDRRPYVVLGADDVGAPHERARVFVLAYAQGVREREQENAPPALGHGRAWTRTNAGGRGIDVADAARIRTQSAEQPGRGCGALAGGGHLANPDSQRREGIGLHQWGRSLEAGAGVEVGCVAVADPDGPREQQPSRPEHEERRRTSDRRPELADTDLYRCGQGEVLANALEQGLEAGGGVCRDARSQRETAERNRYSLGEWPPGRDDAERWRSVLSVDPGLAPAQPSVCRVADGVAGRTHGPPWRTDRLRVLGGGVVPAQAALAWRVLWDGM